MKTGSGSPGRLIVIGAGPTGLGAAYRLNELGYTDYLVLERAMHAGGLASSIVDAAGFTWDIGGHVQFSHYQYYDRVLDRALGEAWLTHERESWIWIRDRFVPYPFQHNLHRLDPQDSEHALAGLEAAARQRAVASKPANFAEWITYAFGEPLANLFMRPYNLKVWGFPLETIDIGWMGDRIALPDPNTIRAQLNEKRDQIDWGPNQTFRFPRRGGTGAIWQAVAQLIPADRLRFGADVMEVDADGRQLTLTTGESIAFDTLISSMPVDTLIDALKGSPPDLFAARLHLRHSAVHVVGIGLEGPKPEAIGRKCWMYFPEPRSPYHRVTVFSNYSPCNVPDENSWSLMAEVCESAAKPVAHTSLLDTVLTAMESDGLVRAPAQVVSRFHHYEEHGYPTPFLGRDAVLAGIRSALEAKGIFSRGRFGAWKYEVSNQDHSFMQGVELADSLVLGRPEFTIDRPNEANKGRSHARFNSAK